MLDKSDIRQTIVLAYHLYTVFGQALLQDEDVQTLLLRLNQNIKATQKEMIVIGLVNDCADCAVNGEGTCCRKRTGHKYDSILLLINLLLGETLPPKPQDPHLCYFLTKNGCVLRARHVICVNFLCKRLRKTIPHDSLVKLQEITGKELTTLFVLEEFIKKKIKQG